MERLLATEDANRVALLAIAALNLLSLMHATSALLDIAITIFQRV